MQVHTLSLHDPAYPPLLKEIPHPPACLYFSGNLAALKSPTVAVVGTRRATPQGIKSAQYFSKTLSEQGLTVASGLAYGIDAAAHEGALLAESPTIAVLAQGLPDISPRRHRPLAEKILKQGGLLVSEYPPGKEIHKGDYLVRNRIISGLSLGVVVVEAPQHSGAINTAHHALEQNRLVMALPGRLEDFLSEGCNRLIQEGAYLLRTPRDIVEYLGLEWKGKDPLSIPLRGNPIVSHILSLLQKQARSGAELLQISPSFSASDLYQTLAQLELDGIIELSSDLTYRLKPG